MRGVVRTWTLAWIMVVLAGVVAAGPLAARPRAKCGTVTINEQAWIGSTANTYVAKAVLEKYLGCRVRITQFAEIPAFQALATGATDAVLEDWQHTAQYAQYISKRHSVVMGGPNGVVGHIGWFVPTYLVTRYPQLRTWQGLKGRESLFKGAGVTGTFLGGDPSYVHKDTQLIQALGLKLAYHGVKDEQTEVSVWTSLYAQREPVLFYWYTPQHLNAEYQLTEVKLPPRFPGCVDSVTTGTPPKDYRCAYANQVLNKLFGTKFAKTGSPAYPVLKRFSWSNSDQESVAQWIIGDHMSPDAAGQKWVSENKTQVMTWLGK
jgi:glycine betaine/proline transport system substrate-binding protein